MIRGELQRRLFTGLLGGGLWVVWLVWSGPFGKVLGSLSLSLACLDEFSKLAYRSSRRTAKRYFLLAIGAGGGGLHFFFPEQTGILFLFFATLLLSFFLAISTSDLKKNLEEALESLWALLFLGGVPLLIPKMSQLPQGSAWLLFFFATLWMADSAAYCVGRLWGRHLLIPKVSPKKTWEGLFGAFVGNLILGIAGSEWFFQGSVPAWATLVFSWGVTFWGLAGDLFESGLKRVWGVKDSGSILPGHGGWLDRFDSFFFAFPWAYAWVLILMSRGKI